MDKYSREEMRHFISNFLSEMHDYVPPINIPEEEIQGCFNTYYHGNIGEGFVNPKVEKGEISFPKITVAYVLTTSGDILVIDRDCNPYKLEECYGDSYTIIFGVLRDAYRERMKYTENKNDEL